MTRLETFMRANKIRPGRLAEEACMSPGRLRRIRRAGFQTVRVSTALRIRDACGRLIGRYVMIAEIVEFE